VLLHAGRAVAAGTAVEVLTEHHLAAYYGVRARVSTTDDGTVVVIPRR
jgi:ABC-type cobalamin/Fe3+-siderophores transport system ATPase subunit